MRKYKIVEEKKPSEQHTRWTPMVATVNFLNQKVLKIPKDKWEHVSSSGYLKSKKEAKKEIDKYEDFELLCEGKYIIKETSYKPKRIIKTLNK